MRELRATREAERQDLSGALYEECASVDLGLQELVDLWLSKVLLRHLAFVFRLIKRVYNRLSYSWKTFLTEFRKAGSCLFIINDSISFSVDSFRESTVCLASTYCFVLASHFYFYLNSV